MSPRWFSVGPARSRTTIQRARTPTRPVSWPTASIDLILRCERAIAHLDGTARQSAEAGLTAVTDYLARSVDTYTATKSAPTRSADWRALADRLKTAHKSLLDELENR